MNILGVGMRCRQRLCGHIEFRVTDPSRRHHTIWSTVKTLYYNGRSRPDQGVLSFQNDLSAEEYATLMNDNVEDLTELRLWSLEKIKENKAKVARAYNKKV